MPNLQEFEVMDYTDVRIAQAFPGAGEEKRCRVLRRFGLVRRRVLSKAKNRTDK